MEKTLKVLYRFMMKWRRSRSCFVAGEISRVTVWFVSGGHINSTPAVVNANSGEGEIGGACVCI